MCAEPGLKNAMTVNGWMYPAQSSDGGVPVIRNWRRCVSSTSASRVAPKPVIDPNKAKIDMDTVKAVFNNRYQVMSRYAKDVTARVVKEELRKAQAGQRSLLKRVRSLLSRDESLIDAAGKAKLEKALAAARTRYEETHPKIREMTVMLDHRRGSDVEEGVLIGDGVVGVIVAGPEEDLVRGVELATHGGRYVCWQCHYPHYPEGR